MLNKEAIRLDVAPKDGNFGFDISECEAKLPAGTVDHSVERVYEEVYSENKNNVQYKIICMSKLLTYQLYKYCL